MAVARKVLSGRGRRLAAGLAGLAVAAGCLVVTLDAHAEQQPTKAGDSPAEIFTWDARDHKDTVLRPVDSHVCFLTSFIGNYNRNGTLLVHRSTVDLFDGILGAVQGNGRDPHWNENSDVWKLGGWQLDGDAARGEAACVPSTAFVTEPGGVMRVSTRGHAWVSTPAGIECDTRTSEADMGDGQFTTFLAGFRGGFYSLSDYVYVKEPQSVSERARVGVAGEACLVSRFEADAYAVFVGVPGRTARYPYFAGTRTNLRVDHQQSAERPMVRTRDGVCFLKGIGGDIQGDGESGGLTPKVIDGEEWWVLHAKAAGGQVDVTASCIAYDQRERAEPPLDPNP